MKLRTSILTVASVLLLSACASTPQGQRAERIAVQGATVALIEHSDNPADKAARVVQAVDLVQTLLLDQQTTVGDLRAALLRRVGERELSPGEKVIALEVIASLGDVVEQKVGKGYLSPEAVLSVNEVLSWVENTAALYVRN